MKTKLILLILVCFCQNKLFSENQIPVVTSTPPNSIWGPPNQYCYFAYEIRVEDDDSDVTFVTKKIPSWLQLNKYYPKSAFLQGTPEFLTTDSVVIVISDDVHTIEYRFELSVRPLYNPPSFATEPTTEVIVDSIYTYEAIVNPGAIENSIITLECVKKPEWITFEKDYPIGYPDERKRARLIGKPLLEGEYEILLTAKFGIVNLSEINKGYTIIVKKNNTAINSIDADKFKIFLSLDRNTLHFTEYLSEIAIFDTFGKIIGLSQNTSYIDIKAYTKGIYLVKAKNIQNTTHISKFIK